jgi:integrase
MTNVRQSTHEQLDSRTKKAVYIGAKHLVKGDKRKTWSDSDVTGFTLRTTPNGSFTFYFVRTNPATKKLDWHLIGKHPSMSIADARIEARSLALLADKGHNIKQIRGQKRERARIEGVTFKQLHDEYIKDCQTLVRQRWGMVPRKESWKDIRSALKRPLEWWGSMALSEITDSSVMDLYQSFVDDDHVPQGNRIRTLLHTMFKWAIQPPRKYLNANPCATLPQKQKEVPVHNDPETGEKRVLSPDELRTLWFGLDDPKCPGDRLSKLALKLMLVTTLRGGEICSIERKNVERDYVKISLGILKSRRHDGARDIVQPLNSLARDILAKIFEGDDGRRYAFPGTGKRSGMWMDQKTLGHLVTRKSSDEAGKEGICEFLGMKHWTPHALRRTPATILSELDYTEVEIGKVLTHKPVGKEASPTTRNHYIVGTKITNKPADKRVEMLDALDGALREILGLKKLKLVASR